MPILKAVLSVLGQKSSNNYFLWRKEQDTLNNMSFIKLCINDHARL
jgi:hypothetical protein